MVQLIKCLPINQEVAGSNPAKVNLFHFSTERCIRKLTKTIWHSDIRRMSDADGPKAQLGGGRRSGRPPLADFEGAPPPPAELDGAVIFLWIIRIIGFEKNMSYNHQKSTAGLWLNSIISAAFIRIAKGLPIKELTNKHFSSLYLLLVQQASDATRPAGCSMGGSVTYCYCTVIR